MKVDSDTWILRENADVDRWRVKFVFWDIGMRLQHGLSLRSKTGNAMERLYVYVGKKVCVQGLKESKWRGRGTSSRRRRIITRSRSSSLTHDPCPAPEESFREM